jgi:hypothetical protein
MHIEKPILGQITQGTIFTAATAESYPGLPVWGLCITARCDMAHENKIGVFNYVPIIRYEDWLKCDGARILTDRIGAELNGALKNFLTANNKSETILESYSPNQIADTLFPGNAKFLDLAKKFETLHARRQEIPINQKKLSDLVLMNKKISEKAIKELWSNQLMGYYFFNDIGQTDHGSEKGYVVLLREVHHLPRNVATAIADGYLIEDQPVVGTNEFLLKNNPFDFACSIGVIKSPWIEHVLQQFSIMFSRIGLPDPKPASLKLLHEAMTYVD